ncbi:MAG: Dihydrolipoamide acetyltransferase [Betaproteobacteria bacterium]|nr:Dihydrolipoamide acetyltransferase [Betaproteobacteria bacterium]
MSETIEVKVPDIGDYKDVPVIEVFVKPGDSVNAEESLITVESDKATMEVPSPSSGTVKELKVKVGDKVSQGSLVLVLEPAGAPAQAAPAAKAEAAPAPAAPKEQPAQRAPESRAEASASSAPVDEAGVGHAASSQVDEAAFGKGASSQVDEAAFGKGASSQVDEAAFGKGASSQVDEAAFGKAHASPSVRRLAREFGVDLSRVTGSGPKERIVKEDVQAFVKEQLAKPAPAAAGPGLNLLPLPQIDFAKFGEVKTEPLSRIRKLSGANLHRNWVTIPHVTQHEDVDITELEAFRKAQSEDAKKDGVRLTLIAFLIKASVAALKKFPQFNASLTPDGESLVLKQYYNVGVAVDTPNGLVVPVLRDADRKGLLELARELGEVSERMRAGRIAPADMQGGCFSISSLGGIGGTHFTPIINAPEVAILGVGKSAMRPVWNGKDFEPRLMLPLSLSYDHRVIDGALGARFITYLSSVLADIRRLVL